MTMQKVAWLSSLVVAGMMVAGCKPKPAVETGSTTAGVSGASAPAAVSAARGPVGSVSGIVSFKGKVPVQPVIDTSMDPACAMSGGTFTAEQYVVNAGKLANVFVYVKSGPAMGAAVPSTQPVVLDQKGCRYVPHVIGVMQGGSVEFRNSDPTMHNIHTMPTSVGNETIDISQGPRGAPQSKQFKSPELMIPVRCNNHPWMNAFINVSATPFFAISGTDGTFSLKGLPPGDYVLGAVHEKLGEKTISVHIEPNGNAKADFGFAVQ